MHIVHPLKRAQNQCLLYGSRSMETGFSGLNSVSFSILNQIVWYLKFNMYNWSRHGLEMSIYQQNLYLTFNIKGKQKIIQIYLQVYLLTIYDNIFKCKYFYKLNVCLHDYALIYLPLSILNTKKKKFPTQMWCCYQYIAYDTNKGTVQKQYLWGQWLYIAKVGGLQLEIKDWLCIPHYYFLMMPIGHPTIFVTS